ncbi:lipopolysaccharide biosynthesis protein [Ruminiclostridium cellobioparum]|uniref:Membrane protein involved in the export of O-antigen and teichoic acid n=1 Tax=Ruminiclostridium cellobioparum subsp. termitidis CT1112 TaxID=1195236 RepID=S0FGR1_RUMCE|nr:polysaccharide biosynthesis C-terminal domain-containing protein [Ruminiclostridium cellobioparum]EMS70357.1 Membrane protein involved in the export of O-antigen and teichoic acid [Ruminiclostridium cellobioparum subsp. termitidis CT1112]
MIIISDQLERKYNNGAKVVLLVSVLAIPLQLATSAVISRVSAEASGILGIIELFYNIIITFFLFGGETAIVKLLSDIKQPLNKKRFIVYYIRICLIYFVVFTVAFRLFGIDIIKIFVGIDENTTLSMYLAGILIIICNILLAYVKEQEHFFIYSIGTKVFNIVTFFGTLYIAVINKSNAKSNLFMSLFIGFILLLIYLLIKNKLFNLKALFEFKRPEQKIFKYALFLHLSTIMAFIFDKADQIIIINKLGLGVLGGYYLIVKIVNMIKLIPNIYNSTFYPYICKQLNKETSNKIFGILINRNLMIIFPITVSIVMNSKLIVRVLFGPEYLDYTNILQLFTITVIISAPAIILNNYLFALGKSKQYFIISVISVVFQVSLMLPLLKYVGIEGLVIVRVVASIITISLCKLYLRKMDYEIKLSNQYYLYCSLLCILGLIIKIKNTNDLINLLITIVVLIIFCIFNRNSLLNLIKVKQI